jgi:hypothetical protein
MRKALLPMIASLALCGAATGALIATNARAEQSGRTPVMLAAAQEPASGVEDAAPASEGGSAPHMMRDRTARHGQFCKDMYARKVGEMAFLEAKLSLTANQNPLFDQWKQASLQIAKQREGECTSHMAQAHTPGQRPSVVDRLNREETMLKRRLADIDAVKPSLTAFYDSLTPEQKQEFGHGRMGHHHMGGRMHMMMGMMGRPHPPEMGDHMGRGPMGDAPPPAPAQ